MSVRQHDLAPAIATLDAGGHVPAALSPTYLIVVLALGLLVGAGLLAWLVYVVGDGVRRGHRPDGADPRRRRDRRGAAARAAHAQRSPALTRGRLTADA